jgi:hypothetical protein
MGKGGQPHAPATLPPKKRPGTHCAECWVGPRAGRDGGEKSRPPPAFDPRTVQPVASRYTNYAISAHNFIFVTILNFPIGNDMYSARE